MSNDFNFSARGVSYKKKRKESLSFKIHASVEFAGIKKTAQKSGLVPRTGFEPAHPCERCDLNTVRLPISPPGHLFRIANVK
jgi:hypothetical protein